MNPPKKPSKRPGRKPVDKRREKYEGAKPVHYVEGRLYYMKDKLLETDVQKKVPSQQPAKFKKVVPKADVAKIMRDGLRAVRAAGKVA